ncbi:Dopey, N-terminal-domain-containing protein [Umbelopsis sp. AD052]|nr:Dopey, N-terminal-domain-containing protein [Umbelopsis sp. AD052]
MATNGASNNYNSSLMRSASPSGSTTSTKSASEEYANDPRYKKYVQLVEKNLQFFDAVNEWADIISFLGRLLRAFQAYPQYPVIPRKMTVAKRLAQCLNPGFPAGVHQKTLDVYTYIFETIEPNQLVEDLPLWSAGVFPFVQHAATHVKPQLLSIFEKYYVRLGPDLKPAMRGLVIALLPVVEEEGSEFFDKGIALIDQLGKVVELPFLHSCIWMVLINNASLRLAALNYLLRRLPKLDNQEDIAAVLGGAENINLMVRSFAATLGDSHILVQRNMLELLVQNYRLNTKVLSHNDRVVIMKAAAGTVLRKDMSLNRRLYAWILGPDESPRAQLNYMLTHAHQPFVQAINTLFTESIARKQDREDFADGQRPYRMLVSLMDKWEVGQPVLNTIFLDVVRCLKKESQLPEFNTEVRHSANMWLDLVDPYLVWSKLFALMDTRYPGKEHDSGSRSYQQELDDLSLILFLLQTFKMADEEIQQMHMPLFLAAAVRKLEEVAKQPNFSSITTKSNVLVSIISTLLHLLAPGILQDRRPSKLTLDSPTETDLQSSTEDYKTFTLGESIIEYARNYYGVRKNAGDASPKLFTEFVNTSSKEDGGDMSMASLPNSISESTLAIYNTPQPKYDPVRGSVLINELINATASFITIFIQTCSQEERETRNGNKAQYHSLFHSVCEILGHLMARANIKPIDIQECMDALFKCSSDGPDFTFVSSSLNTLLHIADSPSYIKASPWHPKLVKAIVDNLWNYLSADSPFCHNRTVQLIWQITAQTRSHLVESIVCSYLVDPDLSKRTDSYARFGLFWRLSEDDKISVVFAKPMFIMLDLIKRRSTVAERRAGETFIRCHLRSYTRLLEPIILGLLEKRIVWRPATFTVTTKAEQDEEKYDITYFQYARPFDWDISDYMFETLMDIVKFGGLGALRSFASYHVLAPSQVSDVFLDKLSISTLESVAHDTDVNITYLDALIAISLRYLQSEPVDNLSPNAKIVNNSIQGHASELLLEIVTTVDFIDIETVATIHQTCLQKLLFCIHTGKLDPQTRLLHIVHSTLSILANYVSSAAKGTVANAEKSLRRKLQVDSVLTDPMGQFDGSSASRNVTGATAAAATPMATSKEKSSIDGDVIFSTSGLFIRCVTDAFSTLSNRPVLQHWMDFWLTSLPNLRGYFRDIILPLLISICDQTTICRNQFETLIRQRLATSAGPAELDTIELPDSYILIFLNGIEKMMMFCLMDKNVSNAWVPGHKRTPSTSSTASANTQKTNDTSALRGFALLLYGDDAAGHTKDQPHEERKGRDTILFHLPTILQVLVDVWDTFDTHKVDMDDSEPSTLGYFASCQRVHSRLEKTLERLYRSHSVDTVEACVELFFMSNPAALEFEMSADQKISTIVFDFMLAAPSGKPQHVVPLLFDGIRARSSGMYLSRPRVILRTGKLTDTSLMRFAEIYCDTLVTSEELASMWQLIQTFSKDYLSQTSATMKMFIPTLLRFLTTVQEKLYDGTVAEDRRVRKEAQDVYQRVIDYCILIAGRSFDQGIWLRRTNVYEREEHAASSDKVSLNDATATEMGRSVSGSTVSDLEKRTGWKAREDTMIEQINLYIANIVIPKLKHLIVDQDRINSLLNNLVYYVIGPVLKTKPSLSKVVVFIDQIYEMAKLPFTYRTWRKEIWEMFLDSRFFYMSAATCQKWRTIIQAIMTAEKERFVEVANRISTSPSTALFSNREQESLARALNLRRLTFIIFSGTNDQFISQLPIIQEKLVELLKLDHNELIHVEIYLCLRVIITRFSQRHLTNFWPVILTEMMRLFNSFLGNDMTAKPEEAQIALAGCKFLDLLCTLETESFQIYQWIFIVDDIDALLQKKSHPSTIIERFASKLASSATGIDHYAEQPVPSNPSIDTSNGERKRPMLTMRNIGSVHQLEFFVNHISLYVYQANLSLAPPDIAFIEGLLQNDLLEGDMD